MIVEPKRINRHDLLAAYFWTEVMRTRGITVERVGRVYFDPSDGAPVVDGWIITWPGGAREQEDVLAEWRAFEKANADSDD